MYRYTESIYHCSYEHMYRVDIWGLDNQCWMLPPVRNQSSLSLQLLSAVTPTHLLGRGQGKLSLSCSVETPPYKPCLQRPPNITHRPRCGQV